MARLAVLVALAASSGSNALAPAPAQQSRRVVLNKFVSGAVGVAAVASASPALAYKGVYGMDTVDAKDAVKDMEALNSKEVQAAIKDLNALSVSTLRIQCALNDSPNFDVAGAVRKELNIYKVRDTFNALNAVFDEDTQKSTDRSQRGILQDLLEVETNGKVKSDGTRSEKKLATTKEKLNKLEEAFKKLDSYFV